METICSRQTQGMVLGTFAAPTEGSQSRIANGADQSYMTSLTYIIIRVLQMKPLIHFAIFSI